MKFIVAILSGVSCWAERDIHGTFVATSVTCTKASEIHFGPNEVLIKKFPKCYPGHDLFRGHWYKANPATILEGGIGYIDTKVPIIYISKNKIKYHQTEFVRATGATSLDTLAMVGYGSYAARDTNLDFKRILFHEGEAILFYSNSVKVGYWNVTRFSDNSVQGTIGEGEPITVVRISNSSLEINSIIFDKESQ